MKKSGVRGKRAVGIGLALGLLLMLFPATAAWAEDAPELAARSVLLADMDTGRVLYTKNADERCEPASLTKIMTVLLAVEAIESGEADAGEYVAAESDYLAGLDYDSSNAAIQLGEQLRLEDLLYCAMLVSANESCNIIARHLAGSIEAFADRMNERAQQLGCWETHFVNPNGLHVEDHYTTARDLYRITREAMSHPLFAQICSTAEYTVGATYESEARELRNTNALLLESGMYGAGYVYDGAFGVKTGHTDEAGYCLVSAVQRDDLRLMAVVLGCEGSYEEGYGSFSDTIRLYDWAFERFEKRLILESDKTVATAAVDYGLDEVSLRPAEDVTLVLPGEETPEVVVSVEETALTAPISAGEALGTATVVYDGEQIQVPLVAQAEVERNERQWFFHRLFGSAWFWVAAALVLLTGAYILSQRVAAYRRRKKRARRQAARAAEK